LHRISGRIFVLCGTIGSFSSIDDTQVGLFSFLVNKGNFNFELDLSRIEHLMLQSQLNDVIVLDANQDGHKDLYFQQKISSKINAPIKLAEQFTSMTGTAISKIVIYLGCLTSKALKMVSQQRA